MSHVNAYQADYAPRAPEAAHVAVRGSRPGDRRVRVPRKGRATGTRRASAFLRLLRA